MTENPQLEQLWRDLFTNPEHPVHRHSRRARRFWKRVPGSPRCKMCAVPLSGVAAPILKFTGKAPSPGNPRFCNQCEMWAAKHPGGAEVEMTFLFADVRGSTGLAEEMNPGEFAEVMRRFYEVANGVLIQSDAWMDKPVGDEIIALYVPIFTGNHAARAIDGASQLLGALGYTPEGTPWIEVGGGVHTGVAYIGTVGVEGTGSYDVTVLGDAVNVTSRLASLAEPGEFLISESAARSAGRELEHLARRDLDLRGRNAPLSVRVMKGTAARV